MPTPKKKPAAVDNKKVQTDVQPLNMKRARTRRLQLLEDALKNLAQVRVDLDTLQEELEKSDNDSNRLDGLLIELDTVYTDLEDLAV